MHRDVDPLFDDLSHALSVNSVVVSIPLMPFTEKSDATETWMGTHLYPGPYPGKDRSFDAIAAGRPFCRMLSPLGGLVLRDPRMWHCGMPNSTKSVRTMLIFVY